MRRWRYESAGDLDRTLFQRLAAFPREPDLVVYTLRMILGVLWRGWLRVYQRLRIRGGENLPAGSCVIVANHQSHLDSLAILSALPLRRMHHAYPAAARDYFFENIPRLCIATVMVNAVPFARDPKGCESLRTCRKLLARPGTVLILYPEGTRSATGEMGPFLPGVGAIVAGRDIPVVPCRLDGAFEACPKHARFPRPRRITATFGKPMRFGDRPRGRASAEAIASELRAAVRGVGRGGG
ncbi:MAG: lysophospholipid acyltransferase family protein [Planctomycetota bacterium]